ncbi:MAG: DNA mismatch endonuclease Vsr [Capsulimonadales bacterium]|nr:DNA mismatch endonuclease Vsr [Capsulimonadales bacterium]
MADIYSPEKRSAVMRSVRTTHTQPERTVRRTLHALGYRFRLHRKDLPGRPDIVLPRHHTVLFVHGCFWHRHDCPKGTLPVNRAEFWRAKLGRNIERDRENRQALEQLGWRVVTIWECETKTADGLRRILTERMSPEISRSP